MAAREVEKLCICSSYTIHITDKILSLGSYIYEIFFKASRIFIHQKTFKHTRDFQLPLVTDTESYNSTNEYQQNMLLTSPIEFCIGVPVSSKRLRQLKLKSTFQRALYKTKKLRE